MLAAATRTGAPGETASCWGVMTELLCTSGPEKRRERVLEAPRLEIWVWVNSSTAETVSTAMVIFWMKSRRVRLRSFMGALLSAV